MSKSFIRKKCARVGQCHFGGKQINPGSRRLKRRNGETRKENLES